MRYFFVALVGILGACLMVAALRWPGLGESAAPAAVTAERPLPEGPNVVFILVDTLRGDRLHAERNGLPVMPKLSALAATGRLFTNANSVCSWTRPSVSSLITGQYVDTHQVYFGISPAEEGYGKVDSLSDRFVTLAETMADAGYENIAYFVNGHLQGPSFRQGYDEENYHYMEGAPANVVTDAVLNRMRDQEAPFYLYVHYIDPHVDYSPPQMYKDMFAVQGELTEDDKIILEPRQQGVYTLLTVWNSFSGRKLKPMRPFSEVGKETMRAWYDGECRFIDDEVTRLIERIRARHPDTLFVFTSDHGEEFWEHNTMGHGTTLYQEQIHVPLFIVGPGVSPEVIDTRVENIGIFKTLCARLGLRPAIEPRGLDLLAPEVPSLPVFSRTRGPSTDLEVNIAAGIDGPMKVINYPELEGRTELYNLESDGLERSPLGDDAMREQMMHMLTGHRDGNIAVRPPRIQREQVELTPEHLKMMRDLGYVRPAEIGEAEDESLK